MCYIAHYSEPGNDVLISPQLTEMMLYRQIVMVMNDKLYTS